ncbi:TauD/TfdA family dioxygenase [Candidatus Parabeggiatoa sp. HSG14]|uniref:TauD/TfdA dioxygenase family protein n=1 Tax=Candidatus Parabeggiatoa sp. HSG14 TaxID=3055593 RepID=UPI0025A89C09|nr:TauD/TfdA family dioxygenase [Thiotrichales bacterium HSG14]
MKSSSTLSVHQLKPFGAKLTNVDLDNPEQRDSIKKLLYENGVLLIPADRGACAGSDPISTNEHMLQLAKIFGEIENYHPVMESEDTAGKVQILETMGNTGIPADSFFFHSDMSWRADPTRACVLRASIVPPSGGNTRFRSANTMYRRLSKDIQKQLHNLDALHSLKVGYARVNRPNAVQDDVQSIHPAIIKHPDTDVPLLYLNPNFTIALVGMPEQESAELLQHIFKEIDFTDDDTLSHSWVPGDVAVWDNFGVQHQAMADYQGLRRMNRVAIRDPHLRIDRYVGENTQQGSIT